MYKPSGMPPYPTQGFHFVPAFPPQDGQRPIGPAPVPHAGVEPQQAPPRPAAPAFGLITDLPLPVPTADSQVPTRHSVQNQPIGLLRLQFLYFYTVISRDTCTHCMCCWELVFWTVKKDYLSSYLTVQTATGFYTIKKTALGWLGRNHIFCSFFIFRLQK